MIPWDHSSRFSCSFMAYFIYKRIKLPCKKLFFLFFQLPFPSNSLFNSCLSFFLFQIRGLQIDEAIKQMTFSTKRAAGIIKQVWKANKCYMSVAERDDHISTDTGQNMRTGRSFKLMSKRSDLHKVQSRHSVVKSHSHGSSPTFSVKLVSKSWKIEKHDRGQTKGQRGWSPS